MARPITPPGPISSLDQSLDQAVAAALIRFGWAPGDYSFTCRDCPLDLSVDNLRCGNKHSIRCKEHAIYQLHQHYLIAENDNRELRKLLEKQTLEHDKRVEELIRANGREVVRRREINAHRMKLLEYVTKARDQFRFYARQHREKIPTFELDLTLYDIERDPSLQGDVDRINGLIEATQEKARVNDQIADAADEAILWECEPGAMGKP
jgi:hypothetical protein